MNKITANKIIPSVNAINSLMGDSKIPWEAADKISDMIVALGNAQNKISAMSKLVMGERESISKDVDKDFDEVIKKLDELMGKEIEIDITPIDPSALRGIEISPSSLAVLKLNGLIAKVE